MARKLRIQYPGAIYHVINRAEPGREADCKPIERGWCLGPAEFKAKLLDQREDKLDEHHSGQLRHEKHGEGV